MLTAGKGTHYCVWCGFDMKAKEERECAACDGDICQARKRAAKTAPKKKAKPSIAPDVDATDWAAAYVRDRAHQYVPSSGIHDALLEVARAIEQGEHVAAGSCGELDDLVGEIRKRRTTKKPRGAAKEQSR